MGPWAQWAPGPWARDPGPSGPMGPVGPWTHGPMGPGPGRQPPRRPRRDLPPRGSFFFLLKMIFCFSDLIKIKRTTSPVAFICRSQKSHSSAMCHKTKDSVFTKNTTFGGGRRRQKNFLKPPAPIPITPRDNISRSGTRPQSDKNTGFLQGWAGM